MPAETKSKIEVPSLRSLFPFAKPYAGRLVLSVLFLVAGRVAASLDPVWLKKIIDKITSGTTLQALTFILATYFGLKLLAAASDFLRDYIFAPAEMGIARDMSRTLFTHLLSLPVSFHGDQRIGGTSRKITRGARAVTFIMDFFVSSILPTILQLGIVTFLLIKLYGIKYAFITFATVAAYSGFTVWATAKRQGYRTLSVESDDAVGEMELDSLGNIDTVKYFNSEPSILSQYEPAIKKRHDMTIISNRLFSLVDFGQAFILMLGLGAILLLGISQAVHGSLTIGDLVLLTTYVVQLAAPVSSLAFVYRAIKDGLVDLQGMAELLKEDITVKEPEHPVQVAHPKGEIALKDVTFAYEKGGRKVLDDVSLTVKPGQKVAFVGPSGVGKSTVVKLLFRLYEPQSGSILIDGVPLSDLAKESRRDMFAIVPQEPALFNASIAENIRFAKPEATQEEMEAAAKLANIHDFIQTLPEKYETTVGERGVKLSGGEKQRVAIARAVIRDPKILVFDEATSALDSHSEETILGALDHASKGRTTVAIAHRLSTIADSDVIYVLDKGVIAEKGSHRELLAKKGLYAQLWKIQAEQKEREPLA
jgi:ATP-binding cassette, subfamily B, heavy metal transporter